MSGSGREAFQMSGIDREACRMSGSVRKAIPNVWEWSEGPRGCLGVVVKPSWMSGRPSRMSWSS